ncbi:Uncharacterised protein [Streptobacillus moniliformis]|nr:Uncharacterised protein [Streptobacillus moniliformis]
MYKIKLNVVYYFLILYLYFLFTLDNTNKI